MEKWSLNNRRISTYNIIEENKVFEELNKKVSERNNFSYNNDTVIVPRYFYRFIGIKDEEAEYYNDLYDLNKNLSKYNKLYTSFTEGLEDKIDNNFLRELNIIWSKLLSLSEITSNSIVNMLDLENLLPDFPNSILSRQIRTNLEGLLDYYFEVNNNEIDPNEFKQLLFYLIFWVQLYFEKLFMDFDYISYNPKILFYGDIAKEEIYFLIFVSSLGCDILYYNPRRDCDFFIVDPDNVFSIKKDLGRKANIEPFPTSKRATRTKTVTKQASEEIQEALFSNETYTYKPWQFADYSTQSVTLKTTYDEIFILAKEKARFRSGWEVADHTTYIPNIFAKVKGVHSNMSEYWKKMHNLMDLKHTLFFKELPISKQNNQNRYNEYWACLDGQGRLSEDKMLHSNWWPYSYLPSNIQKLISNRISELCYKPRMKYKGNKNYEEFQVEIFSHLIDIEEKFLKILQKFDFPQDIPKIIVYNNEHNGDLTFHDAIILSFLNSMGLDIVVFNPSGHNDIENHVEEEYYDIHRLEEIEFDLPFKEKSFFSRFFS